MQNPTGGYGSYELRRGPLWLEWINPAEVFGVTHRQLMSEYRLITRTGHIMIEYDYPECTTSCLTALATFRKQYPNYRSQDIE